jgi:hypothetical protein
MLLWQCASFFTPQKNPVMRNQSSPPAQAASGFEVLQNQDNNLYFFLLKDTDGNQILRSKEYPALNTAQMRMQSAAGLARQEKNYSHRKEGEKCFFTLVNASKQEMARSAFFEDEDQMLAAIEYVKNSLQTPTNNPGGSKQRQSYRIDLYPKEGENGFNGRIVHLLTDKSATFQGLDMQAISRFIGGHLPTSSSKLNEPESAKMFTLGLLSGAEGNLVQSIESGQSLLYFLLKDFGEGWPAKSGMTAKIAVRSLDGTTITTTESKIRLSGDASAQIALPGSYFSTGLFRVQVTCAPELGSPQTGNTLSATCMFQVF